MIELITDELHKLERDLEKFNDKAVGIANRETVNDTAFVARGFAIQNVRNEFTLRNKFVQNSIKVAKAGRSSRAIEQSARVGSTFAGLERQEFGATIRKRGSEGVPIPTTFASGEGVGVQPRRRLPTSANKMRNIRLRDRRNPGRTRKQKNKIAIKQALQRSSKDRYVFLDLQRKKGIFKVAGGKRNPQIRMVHDLTETSVRVPPSPWLKPAADEAAKFMPTIYLNKLRFQIQRNRLFK